MANYTFSNGARNVNGVNWYSARKSYKSCSCDPSIYIFNFMIKKNSKVPWARYADDGIAHCASMKEAKYLQRRL